MRNAENAHDTQMRAKFFFFVQRNAKTGYLNVIDVHDYAESSDDACENMD